MIKINLLPREVQEKRKAERLIIAGFAGIVIIAVALGGLYAYNAWKIKNAEKELALLQAQTAKMNDAIQALRVYETKLQQLQQKEQLIVKATENRILWSKMLEELMIITPNDIALESLSGNEEGITFAGRMKDPLGDSPNGGHKPVARWLMRLSELRLKPSTWLTSTQKEKLSDEFIKFSNTMKFKKEPMPPAPPSPSGK